MGRKIAFEGYVKHEKCRYKHCVHNHLIVVDRQDYRVLNIDTQVVHLPKTIFLYWDKEIVSPGQYSLLQPSNYRSGNYSMAYNLLAHLHCYQPSTFHE